MVCQWEIYLNPWRAVKERRIVGTPQPQLYGEHQESELDRCFACCCAPCLACLSPPRRRRAPPRDSEQQPSSWSGQQQPYVPRGLYNIRRILAEQCELSSWLNSAPPQIDDDAMCCCVPLRTAIFFTALGHAIISWSLIFFRKFVHSEIRIFTGGYSIWSRTIIDLVDTAGAFFALLGMAGAVYLRASYLKAYQYYLLLHIPAALVMYLTDIPVLWSCELWRTDTEHAVEKFGWNSLVYDLAIKGECSQTRLDFMIKNSLAMVLFLYIVAGTQRFLNELEDEPRYLMRLPKDTPNGAFRAIGLGAASARAYGGMAPPIVGPPVQLAPPMPCFAPGPPIYGGPPMPPFL